MATSKYRTLYEDILSQMVSFLASDATYTTKDFKRLEDIEIDELEKNERFSDQAYQYDLIIAGITPVSEEEYFARIPEENEICGGLNTTNPVNGSGYYEVSLVMRITQPNKGFSNDNSLRFSRAAIGDDILIDIFNNFTGHPVDDHTPIDAVYINNKEIVLSQSTFVVVTKL